jgi:hypothetical protein
METRTVSAETQKKNPYLIKINRVYNTVTVYEKNDKGKYTIPVKAMLCSVGKNGQTLTGTYKTQDKYRWRELMGNVWGQYATRIVNGILFHSVYYYGKKNPATLATSEYNKLGKAASHGCVRLAVKDAKWIYDHCSTGTTVVIYDDKDNPGPLGKPKAIKIATNVHWDPTDPDVTNPYASKQPKITGISNCKIAWGKTFDLFKGLKATSSLGRNITSHVSVKGEVDTTKPGKYKITYSVTDALNKTITKTVTVTVLDNKTEPEFTGIKDRVVNSDTVIDSDFLMTGVEASCEGIQLDNDLIGVTIDKISDLEYEITYSASIGNGPVMLETSKVYIDMEAPVLTGIKDITIEEGVIPSKELLLSGVTVSDNYSSLDNIMVDVTFTENPDGSYLAIYTATDQVGNTTVQQATISKKAVTENTGSQ